MPVAGRKPRVNAPIRHRKKPVHDWSEVPSAPYDGPVPELPKKRRVLLPFGGAKDVPLHALTKLWWADVSRMPHCRLWTDSDWRFALGTALVADAFHYGHTPSATELARREKVLGTTVDARRDLRIRYVDPEPVDDGPGDVTVLDDYRGL
jgi:hypothetical protein